MGSASFFTSWSETFFDGCKFEKNVFSLRAAWKLSPRRKLKMEFGAVFYSIQSSCVCLEIFFVWWEGETFAARKDTNEKKTFAVFFSSQGKNFFLAWNDHAENEGFSSLQSPLLYRMVQNLPLCQFECPVGFLGQQTIDLFRYWKHTLWSKISAI